MFHVEHIIYAQYNLATMFYMLKYHEWMSKLVFRRQARKDSGELALEIVNNGI